MLNIFMRIAFILLLFLLICNIFAYVLLGSTQEPITFTEILDKLSNAPTIDLDLNEAMTMYEIAADWGVFNFFRDFLNLFTSIWGFFIWIINILVNLIIVVGYIGYLLGFSAIY